MEFIINNIILTYLIICIMLLVFNVGFVINQRLNAKQRLILNHRYSQAITKQVNLLVDTGCVEARHTKMLKKNLKRSTNLNIYVDALNYLKLEQVDVNDYLMTNYRVYQDLAIFYARRSDVEKACFANMVALHPYSNKGEYRPIMQIMIGYLEGSNIFCRENIIFALCKLGNIQAIETAFQVMHDYSLFHNQKLLTDNLVLFSGDKEALACSLFKHIEDWNINLTLSIIQFITQVSSNYKLAFFRIVNDQTKNIEIRLASLRYFRKYTFYPAKKFCLDNLLNYQQDNKYISVCAATVLGNYSGEDTKLALIVALKSPNWHIRYNAAESLVNLNISNAEVKKILKQNDQYANDMIDYKQLG